MFDIIQEQQEKIDATFEFETEDVREEFEEVLILNIVSHRALIMPIFITFVGITIACTSIAGLNPANQMVITQCCRFYLNLLSEIHYFVADLFFQYESSSHHSDSDHSLHNSHSDDLQLHPIKHSDARSSINRIRPSLLSNQHFGVWHQRVSSNSFQSELNPNSIIKWFGIRVDKFSAESVFEGAEFLTSILFAGGALIFTLLYVMSYDPYNLKADSKYQNNVRSRTNLFIGNLDEERRNIIEQLIDTEFTIRFDLMGLSAPAGTCTNEQLYIPNSLEFIGCTIVGSTKPCIDNVIVQQRAFDQFTCRIEIRIPPQSRLSPSSKLQFRM